LYNTIINRSSLDFEVVFGDEYSRKSFDSVCDGEAKEADVARVAGPMIQNLESELSNRLLVVTASSLSSCNDRCRHSRTSDRRRCRRRRL
jgi:hypothetical protein